MKLLVFAHVPPPHHGQSFMVAQTLAQLRDAPDVSVHHVDARFSNGSHDIGRFRIAKLWESLRYVRDALTLQRHHGLDTLYYVPAPPRRVPVFRDILILGRLRRHFPHLVLHWHAVGLGGWLPQQPTPLRILAHRALGQASVSIPLTPSLGADAQAFAPIKSQVIGNGIPDPAPAPREPRLRGPTVRALFLGAGSKAKGLLAAATAVAASDAGVTLTFAGAFADRETERAFNELNARCGRLQAIGFVSGPTKDAVLAASDVLLAPTTYANEAQPLILLEAMAHDLPIISTRWRGIPETLPADQVRLIEPDQPSTLADALADYRRHPPTPGALRAHFLKHHTSERYGASLRQALAALGAHVVK